MAGFRCDVLGWHVFTDWRSSGSCRETATCDRNGCGVTRTRSAHDFSGPGTPSSSSSSNRADMTWYCRNGCGAYDFRKYGPTD
jgi:hypothetical protein